METIATFLAMDGKGVFIWPSYALSALVLGWLLVASIRFQRSTRAALEDLQTAAGESDGETQA